MIYLRLPSPEIAIRRVRLRVSQGGHDVPEEDIRRRFTRGWENFVHLYRPMADDWRLYDSSHTPPVLIEKGMRE